MPLSVVKCVTLPTEITRFHTMKKLNHLLAWLIMLCCAAAFCACSKEKAAEESLDLRFHNGKFRIAQLTDIHWGDETSDTVLNAMRTMPVSREQTLRR